QRRRIDAIDAQLVALLAERARVVRAIWDEKERRGAPLRDPQREAAIQADLAELARQHGLEPAAVAAIFAHIVGVDLHSGLRAGQPTT
ncbi:MAG: chorismate mutase, partial [Deltaproteobacteria bacterium]|nr:chorismate mutase [Deltaproteobacteria bacterium]